MSNTITPAVLMDRYAHEYGVTCSLSHGCVHALWTATREGRASGRHVSAATLARRTSKTLRMMFAIETIRKEQA